MGNDHLISDFVEFCAFHTSDDPQTRDVIAQRWLDTVGLSGWFFENSVKEAMRVRRGGMHVKLKVLARDQMRCAYCGMVNALTVDHVIPTSRGGLRTSLLNTVASCRVCNSYKGARTPDEADMPLMWEPYLFSFPCLFDNFEPFAQLARAC